MMKKATSMLALALALLLGTMALADVPTAAPLSPGAQFKTGPLDLDASIDPDDLISGIFAATYHDGDTVTILGYDVAFDRANGGLGTLRQFVASLTTGFTVDSLRYAALYADDHSSVTVHVEAVCTLDGDTRTIEDVLTFSLNPEGELVLESDGGTDATAVNG